MKPIVANDVANSTTTLPKSMPDTGIMSQTAAPKAVEGNDTPDPSAPSEIEQTSIVQQAPQPATEFHQFLELPAELRLQIYGYMMPGPRIIYALWNKTRQFYSDCQAPVILHVNAESRKYALEKYSKIVFDNRSNFFGQPSPFGAYIDYTRDIVYLTSGAIWPEYRDAPSFLETIGVDASSRIRHLALPNPRLIVTSTRTYHMILPGMADLTCLRSVLTVTVEPSRKITYFKEPDHNYSDRTAENRQLYRFSGWVPDELTDLEDILRSNGLPENVLEALQKHLVSIRNFGSQPPPADNEGNSNWTKLELI